MKVFRIIVAVAAFAAFTILAQTQTRPAPTPATVAIIDSSAFSDEKAGIGRVMVAMQQIEAKFVPVRNELRTMRDRLSTLRSDIQKKRPVQDASLTAKQTEEANRLEVEIKRKAEDAQTSFQKIQKRKELSLMIYSAKLSFKPNIGQTYYLYEKVDGSSMLSLVSPKEWGKNGPFKLFVAAVQLLADHTWKEL